MDVKLWMVESFNTNPLTVLSLGFPPDMLDQP